MAKKALRIAIPKGGLFEEASKSLAKMGIRLPKEIDKRQLIIQTEDPNWELLIVRGHDVPNYIEHGAADLGIVGSDVLIDSGTELLQLEDLEFGACRLCVCAPKGKYKSLEDLPSYTRVATTFPNITQDFFHKNGLAIEVIHLYGSVELGPLTGLSDVIVDLVASGKTLEKNGLEVIEEIFPCTARLVANNVSYRLNKEKIDSLLSS